MSEEMTTEQLQEKIKQLENEIVTINNDIGGKRKKKEENDKLIEEKTKGDSYLMGERTKLKSGQSFDFDSNLKKRLDNSYGSQKVSKGVKEIDETYKTKNEQSSNIFKKIFKKKEIKDTENKIESQKLSTQSDILNLTQRREGLEKLYEELKKLSEENGELIKNAKQKELELKQKELELKELKQKELELKQKELELKQKKLQNKKTELILLKGAKQDNSEKQQKLNSKRKKPKKPIVPTDNIGIDYNALVKTAREEIEKLENEIKKLKEQQTQTKP